MANSTAKPETKAPEQTGPTKEELEAAKAVKKADDDKAAAEKLAKEKAEAKKAADEKAAIEKLAEEKAAEAQKISDEKAAAQLVASQKLKSRLQKDLDAREYVPQAGTGKHFHVNVEVVYINKTGKKQSNPKPSVMTYESFNQWIKQASRLGQAFGMVHDPYRFYTDKVMSQLKEGVKEYA